MRRVCIGIILDYEIVPEQIAADCSGLFGIPVQIGPCSKNSSTRHQQPYAGDVETDMIVSSSLRFNTWSDSPI